MKQFLVLTTGLLFFLNAFSQNTKDFTIRGTVLDSTGLQPVEFATVAFFLKGSKNAQTGTITDASGKFIIEDAKSGVFSVLLESIGYKSFSFNNISLDKTEKEKDLGIIKLVRLGKTFDAVVITSQKKTIENKIDRLVFNAENDISSQTGTATDVLKKVPQVSVDADGNVQQP